MISESDYKNESTKQGHGLETGWGEEMMQIRNTKYKGLKLNKRRKFQGWRVEGSLQEQSKGQGEWNWEETLRQLELILQA
jgi:hypothetical protein